MIENRWQERLEIVGSQIPDGASVLDLGAGAQGLRELVNGPYTPADAVPWTADTLAFDMDEDVYPEGRWDIAVMAGVLEYATDPERVLKRVRRLAPVVLLTYQTVHRPTIERNRMGFSNHLSATRLERLCRRARFQPTRVGRWRNQTVYRLT